MKNEPIYKALNQKIGYVSGLETKVDKEAIVLLALKSHATRIAIGICRRGTVSPAKTPQKTERAIYSGVPAERRILKNCMR